MSFESKYYSAFEDFQQKYKNEIGSIGKIIGKGAFGEVREIKYKNKSMAVKIMEKTEDIKLNGEKLAKNLNNHNIIKIQRIYENEKFEDTNSGKCSREGERTKTSEKTYDFIILERAVLRDLGKWNEFYYKYNLLKLIKTNISDNYIFDENTGDILIRFYARQIINALGELNQNDYIHFDIKPENLLIGVNLIITLTGFSLLTDIKKNGNEDNIKLPGGTRGYTTPEYYIDKNMNINWARKQDYFALGSSLFLLKYGLPLLKYHKYDYRKKDVYHIIDLLKQKINFLKSQVFTDKDFMNFIISLIWYNPDERADFQKIFRNKWLNKNNDILDKIIMAFEMDEEKLIIELQKKDFLIKKEEKMYTNENNKFRINSKTNKFRFKKKFFINQL